MSSDKTPHHQDQSIHKSIIGNWRNSLEILMWRYDAYRPKQKYFAARLFLFFIALNVLCYWLGILTAFPYLMIEKPYEYLLLQIPVGILGASFDSVSFFITILIARNAINSKQTWKFVLHLSLDLIIAFLATMWVVLVFIFSGWALSFFLGSPEVLDERSGIYQDRLLQALINPLDNLKNIYFGAIMGISAGLPSFMHMYMFLHSVARQLSAQLTALIARNQAPNTLNAAPSGSPHILLSNKWHGLKLTLVCALIVLTCLYYVRTVPSMNKVKWTVCIEQPELCEGEEVLFAYGKITSFHGGFYELTSIGEDVRIFYKGSPPSSRSVSVIGEHIQNKDFKELRREEHRRRIWKFYAGFAGLIISCVYGVQVWRGKWPIY